MSALQVFLEWLEKVIPTILAAFGLGFKVGSNGQAKTQAELEKAKLELNLKENIIVNENNFSGKSDDDIIGSVLGPRSKRDEPE